MFVQVHLTMVPSMRLLHVTGWLADGLPDSRRERFLAIHSRGTYLYRLHTPFCFSFWEKASLTEPKNPSDRREYSTEEQQSTESNAMNNICFDAGDGGVLPLYGSNAPFRISL